MNHIERAEVTLRSLDKASPQDEWIYMLFFLSSVSSNRMKMFTKEHMLCYGGWIASQTAIPCGFDAAFENINIADVSDKQIETVWEIWRDFEFDEKSVDPVGELYAFFNQRNHGVKKAGQFFTPPEISELVIELLQPELPENGSQIKIGDCAAGTGSMVNAAYNKMIEKGVSPADIQIATQELDRKVNALQKMQFFLKRNPSLWRQTELLLTAGNVELKVLKLDTALNTGWTY